MLTVMRGCDPPPLRMASAACCVAPLASAPRFLAMLIREARRRASSNLSVADGINWLGITTVTVSIMKLSQNHADSKHKKSFSGVNRIITRLPVIYTYFYYFILHKGQKHFAHARACVHVCVCARTSVVSALT